MIDALFLEPIGGISGDLFLGAMADLGLDLRELEELLKHAELGGFEIAVERRAEHGIFGRRVTVEIREHFPHAHRSWTELRRFLTTLPSQIADRALAIFGGLAEVEAQIHGVAVEAVEFHEVGAVDSIVDIVGAAWALERLGRPAVFTRPPPLGSGTVDSHHGVLPIPAPATLALLRGHPTLLEGRGELTTPTGAAILAACARFEAPSRFTPLRIGYGVGHTRFDDRPNLLRATLGQAEPSQGEGVVFVLEAHLDDATPQLLSHVLDRLLSAGALDAGLSPLVMKKGRAGQRLTVVCREAQRQLLTEVLLRESPTLGVRFYPVERCELERRQVSVETRYGPLRVKLGYLGAELLNAAPEYDDCRAAAERYSVPLKEVLAEAAAAARRSIPASGG